MVLIPAAAALGVEFAAAVFGLAAVLAVVSDGVVQPGLGFFDGMLAVRAVIRLDDGSRGKNHEHGGEDHGHGCFGCAYIHYFPPLSLFCLSSVVFCLLSIRLVS
jgi:hypothetical protein